MFWNEGFEEKFVEHAKEISIDGTRMYDLSHTKLMAIAAYFYDLYMNKEDKSGGVNR